MTASASPRPPRDPEDELSLAELLHVLHRRRWVLLGCLLLGGLAGIAALATMTPVYEARALVIIEPVGGAAGAATVPTSSQTPDSAAVDSQVQILGSRSLAREAIAALGLADDPELRHTAASLDGPAAWLRGAAAISAGQDGDDPVEGFLARLSVKREGKSHVIAVGWRSADPLKAAAVANRLADLYIAGQLARKEAASRRQISRHDERLQVLRDRLVNAETALAQFRAASEPARAATLGADPGEIAGLDAQLVAATVARAAREATLARLRRPVETGDVDASVGELGGSPLLDNLSALKAELLRREAELGGQYGERHPRIQAIRAEKAKLDARIRDERRALLRAYEGEIARAVASERILAAKLEELKGKALRREAQAARAQELEREVELSRRLVETHLAAAAAEHGPEVAVAPDARVISEAVPPKLPAQPKPRLIMSLALTSGLLLGLAATYLIEVGQRGLRSERDVAEVLALPTLALVPRLDGIRRAGIAPQDYVLDRPRSRYAEALREVLAGLLLRESAAAARGARVLLVTSALPDEGKSTLTLSLARAAAGEGLRVMVIDADLRKPTLHGLVGLTPGPGLVEVLRREAPLAEVLATDPRAPLKLLPGSRRLSQPTRLLGPQGMGVLLTGLRPAFDLILLDSAPLIPVVDAKLLAKLADGVLLVVRYGRTRRDFCELALRGLREGGATVTGVVLTQVDLRRHARSGAGDAGFAYARLGAYYTE